MALAANPASPASTNEAEQDWPQWRGPNRDGVVPASPKLLDAWPAEGPKMLWTSEPIGGEMFGYVSDNYSAGGCGSVSVAGGKAFYFAHCRTKTGKVKISSQKLKEWGWVDGITKELAAKVDPFYGSLFTHGDNLAKREAAIDGFIATLDADTVKKLGPAIKKHLMPASGVLSWKLLVQLAPVQDKEFDSLGELAGAAGVSLGGHDEGTAIIDTVQASGHTFTDSIVCMNADTGKTIWRKDFPVAPSIGPCHFAASSTPTLVGDKCFVTGSAGLYCLSVKDGKLLWQTKTPFSNSSPLVDGNAVYVSFAEGLSAFAADTGKKLWTQAETVSESSSPALWKKNGKSYVLILAQTPKQQKYATLTCLEPATGKILWRNNASMYQCYSSPLVVEDNALIWGYGTLGVFKLTPETGDYAWPMTNLGDERGAMPLVYKNYIYAIGGDYQPAATCLDLKDGSKKWTVPLGHTETTSAVIADGKIFAIIEGAKIVMLKATPEKYEELGRISNFAETVNSFASPVVANGKLYLRLKTTVVCYDLVK
jgi:outer membrane protein assembly factor BamB